MKLFKLYWKDGTTTAARGKDIEDALVNSGFDVCALDDVEKWEEIRRG